MSHWCDNKVTITGPDRDLVLDALSEQTVDEGKPLTMVFSLEALEKGAQAKGVEIPERDMPLAEGCWVSVYALEQQHKATEVSDILRFESQWIEPIIAIRVLSKMFPENVFELQSWCNDLVDSQDDDGGSQVCHCLFRNGVATNVPKQATTKSEGLLLRPIPQRPPASLDAQ